MTGWKGLILAGGTGSRLHPLTQIINKHLLPIYDKPMIFYPLTTLMFAGLTEYVIVTTSSAVPMFKSLLGDGSHIARPDLEGSNIALILGDNIFYGSGLGAILRDARDRNEGATVLSYDVANPSAFGVISYDDAGNPVAIEEKPVNPKSRSAVTGLYLYAPDVLDIAAAQTPSARGELEITDVNLAYLKQKRLRVAPLGRGIAWLDGGTDEDLFNAGQFVKVIEDRTGLKISCPEEIALRLGLIAKSDFQRLVEQMPLSAYRTYLERI
jgi:glucose-1-phosphate thymidylyltransferase